MPFDEQLAERVRKVLKSQKGLSEKKMFGGICFLIYGNMCCGVEKFNLMVRVGSDKYEKLLKMAHVRPMDFTGRPLKGFIYIDPKGLQSSSQLKKWLTHGINFALTLPKK